MKNPTIQFSPIFNEDALFGSGFWVPKSLTYLQCHLRKYENGSESESHSVVIDSLWPHGLYSPWNSPGQNIGVGSHSLLQGIVPTQGSNPGLLHCRQILYQLSHQGTPWKWKAKAIFLPRQKNYDSFSWCWSIFVLETSFSVSDISHLLSGCFQPEFISEMENHWIWNQNRNSPRSRTMCLGAEKSRVCSFFSPTVGCLVLLHNHVPTTLHMCVPGDMKTQKHGICMALLREDVNWNSPVAWLKKKQLLRVCNVPRRHWIEIKLWPFWRKHEHSFVPLPLLLSWVKPLAPFREHHELLFVCIPWRKHTGVCFPSA